jgi:hypothetical protein
VRHPAALILEVDPLDREPLDAQQQRRAALQRLTLNDLNMRTLNQARDLTLVTMNCLDNSHDHRGHGPLTSSQDTRACPLKFEDPVAA